MNQLIGNFTYKYTLTSEKPENRVKYNVEI